MKPPTTLPKIAEPVDIPVECLQTIEGTGKSRCFKVSPAVKVITRPKTFTEAFSTLKFKVPVNATSKYRTLLQFGPQRQCKSSATTSTSDIPSSSHQACNDNMPAAFPGGYCYQKILLIKASHFHRI